MDYPLSFTPRGGVLPALVSIYKRRNELVTKMIYEIMS